MRVCTVLGIILSGVCLAQDAAKVRQTEIPYLTIEKDFVSAFDAANVSNCSSASSSQDETLGKVSVAAIFLHTSPENDAIVSYPAVSIPSRGAGYRNFIVFRVGLRDGIPWETTENPPNGVEFSIWIEGKPLFSERVKGPGWQRRAVDVSGWAGKDVAVEFHTNAIDGNTSYDWAVFGQPLLVSVKDETSPYIPRDAIGLAVVEVSCSEASETVLRTGIVAERLSFDVGTYLIPVDFACYTEPKLEVLSGLALITRVSAGVYTGQLSPLEANLSTPLVTVGSPITIQCSAKNLGRGVHTKSVVVSLVDETGNPPADLGKKAVRSYGIGKLGPGEVATLRWDGLVPSVGGDKVLHAGEAELPFHIFGEAPETPAEHVSTAFAKVTQGQPISAVVGNAGSRLCLVLEDSGDAYALMETWNGSAWQRTGSIYPLAQLSIRMEESGALKLPFLVRSLETTDTTLRVQGVASHGGKEWGISLAFAPDSENPRIKMCAELTAPEDAGILSFYGPSVLAGDRAYGPAKDFAVFPGLEYLEGPEESSSERDLRYPLSDRRVPAAYKIATPLMAVQAQGSLTALLWDMKQEWGAGEIYPAARFLAPKLNSGMEYIHMALFAPSVGKYVKENDSDAANEPYPIKAGEKLRLVSTLVLDHSARHAPDSMVNGPHKGALVLQAMQHWFDVYGMPEPSPQPRDWDAERALCRDAYMHAVWSEAPPGWAHCHGWKPGAHVGYAVPLLLDLRAGTPEPDRSEIQRRVDTVISNAVTQIGKHYLWSNAGCHILLGELPFYRGYLAESMKDFRSFGLAQYDSKEYGLWVWKPRDDKTATLGRSGDHTLGQAAFPLYWSLRAARVTGNMEIWSKAFESLAQMDKYEVPRGAQTWECPLYQPDILAAAQAIRAYCEAYRITGDAAHLAQARYWAWTGLPFLYFWEMDGYPTMRYNVISVIGSTFYTHSWLGLPVVWCGLVYAYALQDLAEFDNSFDWKRIAQGITNSAMWQQYTEGPSKGTYPDSWNMVKNMPNPADINPENILVNEWRLRGNSPEIRFARFQREDKVILLNSAADILEPSLDASTGAVKFALARGNGSGETYSILAQVPEPAVVSGMGERMADSDGLQQAQSGWIYDPELQAVILKCNASNEPVRCEIRWQ